MEQTKYSKSYLPKVAVEQIEASNHKPYLPEVAVE
ncbi:hypothetical protein F383_21037 [Gossypium arboreum]|uniref:Uncharacterized protein n=1 Tax=Gossypium arboreum TaxID=29729 RepID=A0A0B0NWJ5_GOSAR|nr:hypothetical protein F383_21037 [Gossypium arboreum]